MTWCFLCPSLMSHAPLVPSPFLLGVGRAHSGSPVARRPVAVGWPLGAGAQRPRRSRASCTPFLWCLMDGRPAVPAACEEMAGRPSSVFRGVSVTPPEMCQFGTGPSMSPKPPLRSSPLTPSERRSRYELRMRSLGFTRVAFWVHLDDLSRVRSFISRLFRDRRSK